MKKIKAISIISAVIGVGTLVGCGGKESPGRVYMPDMAYSRAYETYALQDSTVITTDVTKRGGSAIYYNAKPVRGTIKRGELFPYDVPNTPEGYIQSAGVQNPIADMSVIEMPEAKRLYQINCAVCHGDKADGQGPLATSGKVGGIANLTLPMYTGMADGTMFHSLTYGRGLMGSYASQLDRRQRWMVINYLRTLQPAPTTAPAAAATADTTKKG
ncbi:MAG: cytochrome c [Ferruginibacter sp.]|nr:cytochrome c [Ferruginibacter sp.]